MTTPIIEIDPDPNYDNLVSPCTNLITLLIFPYCHLLSLLDPKPI